MIIGLTGKRLSGKDTAGSYLVQRHGFERIANADKLKDGVAALFDITREQVDEFKSDRGGSIPYVTVRLDVGGTFTKEFGWVEFLQRFGTDMGRKVWGRDFWIDLALPVQPLYPERTYRGQDIVVTDVRFENEAQRILSLGGVIIKLDRGVQDKLNDAHESEDGLPEDMIDYTIVNDRTKIELFKDLDEVLEDIRANS